MGVSPCSAPQGTPPSSILLSPAELAHLASSGIEVGIEL